MTTDEFDDDEELRKRFDSFGNAFKGAQKGAKAATRNDQMKTHADKGTTFRKLWGHK